MNVSRIVFLVFAIIMSIGIVSAGWFTGNAVKVAEGDVNVSALPIYVENNPGLYTGNFEDSDGGVVPVVAGSLKFVSGDKLVTRNDVCGKTNVKVYDEDNKLIKDAKKFLKEYYYNVDNEEPSFVILDSEDLGPGYCLREKTPEGVFGRWVSLVSSCSEIRDGVFRDENGNIFKDGCQDGHYISYNCTPEDTVEEISNEDCSSLLGGFGRCTATGCAGLCTDTDNGTNEDFPGIVTADGINYPDECSNNGKRVKQYICKDGFVKAKTFGEDNWKNCGTDRVCVIDNNGAGKCVDKSVENVTTIEGLRRIVESLQLRISDLEQELLALDPAS